MSDQQAERAEQAERRAVGVPPEGSRAGVDGVRRFALTEDWAATAAGLVIVVLAAAGVITESWLPL